MHFSTFVPSILHLLMMLYAVPVTLLPPSWNRWAAAQIHGDLKAGTDWQSPVIALWLTARLLLPFIILGGGIWWLFSWGASPGTLPYVGRLFFAPVEAWARLIGAV